MNTNQYVIFNLGKEEYGVDISYTKEIIRIPKDITKMPNSPAFIEGIINLRGKVIPVLDLKKRFNLEQTERNADNRLLILDADGMLLGIIVDDVSEVLMINSESIEMLYKELSGISKNSILGMGKVDKRLILLIDAHKMKEEVFQNVM